MLHLYDTFYTYMLLYYSNNRLASQYDTIKLLRPTRKRLDDLKRSMGYPSYSQIITALVERQKTKEDTINEIRKELAEEASKAFASLFYDLILNLAKEVQKPMTEITLIDLYDIMQKKRQ